MRRYLAEVFGTYALIFAGTGAVVVNDVSGGVVTHVGVASVWGLIVMAMVYAIGDCSGAHMNPAVTIGFTAAGRFKAAEVLPYVAAQLVGAVAASATLRFLFPDHVLLGATIPAGAASQSFVLEVILTAMLMFTVLCVATGSKEQGLLAGIAVGGVVGLEAMFAGPICGASMNPARSLAPALVSGRMGEVWIYLAAPTLGALVAVVLWRLIRPKSCGP